MYAKPHPPEHTVRTASELLQELEAAAQKYFKRGDRPMMCLDLDGTALDGNQRTIKILVEFMAAVGWPHAMIEVARTLTTTDLGYGPETAIHALARKDVQVHDGMEAAFRSYWQERFFTDRYQDHDRTEDGAPEFVHRLVEYGIHVTYLTGRDRRNMIGGVARNLQNRGFPVATPLTHLVLKETYEAKDLEFKQAALAELSKSGAKIIGLVDNEPGICNMAFQRANVPMVAWFDSPHAPNPPQLDPRVSVMKSFVLG